MPFADEIEKLRKGLEKLVVNAIAHTCTDQAERIIDIGGGTWPEGTTAKEWCAEKSVKLDDFDLFTKLLQDTVPMIIKWMYGVIDDYVFKPIMTQINALLEMVVAEITQTLTGVLGLIPYAGGIIGAIILDIVVIIIDALGPSLLSSIVDGLKKVALDLTLQIAPSITDPLISMFVETIKSETDGADATVTDAANSGTMGDFGGGQLKVLIDLVMPMIKDAAEKILSTGQAGESQMPNPPPPVAWDQCAACLP